MQAVGLFDGTLAQFAAAVLPLYETVEAYVRVVDSLEANMKRIDSEDAGVRRKLGDEREQLAALAEEGELWTVADLRNSRAESDALFLSLEGQWQVHASVEQLDATATAYRAAQTARDDLADTLRVEASHVTRVAAAEAKSDAAGGGEARYRSVWQRHDFPDPGGTIMLTPPTD